MSIRIEQEIEKISFDFDHIKLIEDVINASLDYIDCPYEASVEVVLTDEESIREINKEHRDIDSATDVLSFPLIEYENAGDFDFLESPDNITCFNPESGELELGDIVISIPRVIAQAKEYGHSEKRELAFLVAHSMCHLFGFDHMTEDEEKEMFAKQEDILTSLDIKR